MGKLLHTTHRHTELLVYEHRKAISDGGIGHTALFSEPCTKYDVIREDIVI